MDDHAFQLKLTSLMSEIQTLPKAEREKLEKLAAQTKDRRENMKQSMSDLQESLDHLRLSIKYLVFDLEATRRENAYLRGLIETSQASDAEASGEDALDIEIDDDDSQML